MEARTKEPEDEFFGNSRLADRPHVADADNEDKGTFPFSGSHPEKSKNEAEKWDVHFFTINTALIERSDVMQDIFYIVVTVVFFAVAAAFTRGCEKLEKED